MLKNLYRCPSQVWRLAQPRYWSSSTSAPTELTEGEKRLQAVLKQKFPEASTVEVCDISGGCGAMYEVSIEAEEFRGKKTVLQHRLVNEALSDDIKLMHGLRINTKVPPKS